MSKGFDPVYGYSNKRNGVGYKSPPPEHQFSTTNQPQRPKRKLPPREKTTMLELEQEQVRIKQSDGSYVFLKGYEVAREKLIDSAFGGNMKSARRLYEHLDEERAAWIANPRYKLNRRVKRQSPSVDSMARAMTSQRDQLIALGVLEHVYKGEFRIAPWVKQAYERRQHQQSAAVGTRRAG